VFRLISKRELMLYAAQISDMKAEIVRLHAELDRERKRADAAVNALLIKTNKIAITPQEGITLQQEDDLKDKMFSIFGDDQAPLTEEEALEELQR
jgi:hypothetical protein